MLKRELIDELLAKFQLVAFTSAKSLDEVHYCFLDIFLNSPLMPEETSSIDRLKETFLKLYKCGGKYTPECQICEYEKECRLILMSEFLMTMIRHFIARKEELGLETNQVIVQ